MKIPGFLSSKKFLKAFTITWAVTIATISSIPNLPNPEIPENNWVSFRLDYLFHFVVFFILGLAIVLWKIPKTLKFISTTLILILILGSAFAIVDEVHQLIIPGRRYNPIDMAYNLAGFWAGVLLSYFYVIRFLMMRRKGLSGFRKILQNRG